MKQYLWIILVFSVELMTGQQSYQYSLTDDRIYLADIAINEHDEIGLMQYTGSDLSLIAGYDHESPLQPALAVSFGDLTISTLHLITARLEWPSPKGLIAKTRRTATNCGNRGITYFDIEAQQHWDFCYSGPQEVEVAADESSNIYVFISATNAAIFHKISRSGEILRQLYLSGFSLTNEVFEIRNACYAATTNTIAVSGRSGGNTSCLLLTDTLGEVLRSIQLEQVRIDKIVPSQSSGFFALGSTSFYSGTSGNSRDLLLIRLDDNLNVLWSRVFFADHFDYTRAELAALPGGTVALAYSTQGAYPVILAKLDATGEIIWQKGYPLYEPLLKVFSDGSLLMATRWHFDEQGNRFQKAIIAKTDTLGNIEGCETSPTCLQESPMSVLHTDMSIALEEIPFDLNIVPLNVGNTALPTSPFCEIPPPPSPRFDLPDTLCQGSCLRSEGFSNLYAHGIEWSVRGPGVDTFWLDSLAFSYCFERPGTYEVEQSVWFLGCAYRHLQQVTVIDSLQVWIDAPEGLVCEPPPLQISIDGSRPLLEATWGDGFRAISRPVLVGGVYAVTVSDGYCSAVADAPVYFVQDSIDARQALALPADTSICEQELPLMLRPRSAYTGMFHLGGQEGQAFELSAPGSYQVRAEILGCAYEQVFQLSVRDCRARIYLPNAFSPNGDGTNDFLFPQGKDFELIELSVFDRWGGLVFYRRGSQARWDGTSASGRPLPGGLYIVKFAYLHTRLGVQEEAWGEVVLVR
jgi:gliding motility-associated-like protein